MSIKYLNDALITYKWIKTNGSHITSTRSNVLSFSSLRLSDGGTYLCEISVNSNVLIKNATTTVTHEFDVTSKQSILFEVIVYETSHLMHSIQFHSQT